MTDEQRLLDENARLRDNLERLTAVAGLLLLGARTNEDLRREMMRANRALEETGN